MSLRIDAVYCILLGVLITASAPLASSSLALHPLLQAGIGVATAVWGGYVWMASRSVPLRSHTRFVMVANIAAAAGLATTGLVAGTVILSVAALVLAIDVAAFAVSQGIALRRMPRPSV